MSTTPIRIHPKNSKVFEFRGKPIVLLCATEHYGAVINRPFDFAKYLADAADKKQTFTRLFVLFREQQSSSNPYSTCKPESPDFITPFVRKGPDRALDGQPKYNLDEWNPEFFERLHRFLGLASDYGIIVEVTLLSNTYAPGVWQLNPLNAANNYNDLEEIEWMDYNTLRYPKLFARQAAHVRKIVEETNKYDNIFYEICNEPGGGLKSKESDPTPEEVNDWQCAIAKLIRETEADLPNKHLIAGQEAFTYTPWEQPSELSFNEFPIDIVNMHPLPNTTFGDLAFHMGEFMSKQLNLRAYRDYCRAVLEQEKPLNLDEDNVASQYKDYEGWTIHRKRAWTALFNSSHYDYIDFSIINYAEAGTPQSQKYIRTWLKYLSEFIHSLDLIEAKPLTELQLELPANITESAFGITGLDYCIYLADDREVSNENSGQSIKGPFRIQLPAGMYSVACYSPASGQYSISISVESNGMLGFGLPEFEHDLVLRITKES